VTEKPDNGTNAGGKVGPGKPPVEHRFKPGNPGRRKGSRHKRTALLDALADGDLDAIYRKIVARAKRGDAAATKLVVDRADQVRKGCRIAFSMPPVTDAKSTLDAHAQIMRAVAAAELSVDEAAPICEMLAGRIKLLESVEIAARIETLERKAGLRK
jgi:hypothetical protein